MDEMNESINHQIKLIARDKQIPVTHLGRDHPTLSYAAYRDRLYGKVPWKAAELRPIAIILGLDGANALLKLAEESLSPAA